MGGWNYKIRGVHQYQIGLGVCLDLRLEIRLRSVSMQERCKGRKFPSEWYGIHVHSDQLLEKVELVLDAGFSAEMYIIRSVNIVRG